MLKTIPVKDIKPGQHWLRRGGRWLPVQSATPSPSGHFHLVKVGMRGMRNGWLIPFAPDASVIVSTEPVARTHRVR